MPAELTIGTVAGTRGLVSEPAIARVGRRLTMEPGGDVRVPIRRAGGTRVI